MFRNMLLAAGCSLLIILLAPTARAAESSGVTLTKIHDARQATWECQDTLGAARYPASKMTPVGHRYKRWVLNRWADRQRTECGKVRRAQRDPSFAINLVFGEYASQAHRVVSCESGHSVWAQNGQYLGLFQMGAYARSLFGHGSDALTQARAAYKYFVASGRDWSPWSCKPW